MTDRTANGANTLVVLVHGFNASRLVMWPLAYRLRTEGFRVRQWSYLSLFGAIDSHAARFRRFLQSELADEQRIHIVAHSMGCIVVRAALQGTAMPRLGRVVMLAPPNQGSPVADFVSRFLGWLVVPTRELASRPNSYVHRLDKRLNVEVGIIAAKYDLLIPVKNTELSNQAKHVVVAGTHNSILFSYDVGTKVSAFLQFGDFVRRKSNSP
jgi:triacylglycerol lipase